MALTYLLDTNIISEFGKIIPNEKVMLEIERHELFSAICAPVWYELIKGIEILPEGKRKLFLRENLLENIKPYYPVIPYDEHAASLNAAIFAKMKEAGTPTQRVDTQIASIALVNNMILVTRNVKDYEPIAEHFSLCLENWFE